MNKKTSNFLEKFFDKLISASIEKIIIFCGTLGITVIGVTTAVKNGLNHKVTITVSQLLALSLGLILVLIFIVLILKKLKAKQKFKEGMQVVLSTQKSPVMSAGKYNFISNKVQCSWTYDNEIRQQWINQDQLIEYVRPASNSRRPHAGNYWRNN